MWSDCGGSDGGCSFSSLLLPYSRHLLVGLEAVLSVVGGSGEEVYLDNLGDGWC